MIIFTWLNIYASTEHTTDIINIVVCYILFFKKKTGTLNIL